MKYDNLCKFIPLHFLMVILRWHIFIILISEITMVLKFTWYLVDILIVNIIFDYRKNMKTSYIYELNPFRNKKKKIYILKKIWKSNE